MTNAWARLRAAAGDRRSGAAQIAASAAWALGDLPPADLQRGVELLIRGHPTMAPVWRLATEVLDGPSPTEGAARFLAMLERDRRAAVVLVTALPDELITISWSSTVLDAIRLRSPARVVCMRSEPGGEGERLAQAIGPSAVLIEDGDAIAGVPARAVVVGADGVTPAAVVNKVKTRALAEAAADRRIPTYAVTGETKFLASELPLTPLFEPTPLAFFTSVATPWGMLEPTRISALAHRRRIHRNLLGLLEELSGG